MIDFSRIKLPKFVFKLEQKGLFKALGLHHASAAIAAIIIGVCADYIWHFVGLGHEFHFDDVMAIGVVYWYGSREYGNGPYPPKEFEILDFVSPLIVGLGYLAYD